MFSSGRKSAGRAPAGKSGTGGLSFIGTDVVINGDVTSTGQLHIDGRIDGDVKCETLIQGDSGTIAGQINADTAHLAGLIDGTVKARVVTLEPSARVTGDVSYETLSIAAGAAIEGRLTRKEAAAETSAVTSVFDAKAKNERKAPLIDKAEEPGLLAIGPGVTAAGAAAN